jgi:uridine nucleosidase
MLHALLIFFANTYNTVFGLTTGPPLHDPLAVAVILSNLNPAFAKQHHGQALKFHDEGGERFGINIITDGLHGKDLAATGQLGRSFAAVAGPHGVAVPRGVDVNAFWDLVLGCIQRADEWNAARK